MILALLAAAAPVSGPVEAERAFAAMAQTQGQWTAFRAFAAPYATMFVPQTVVAQEWLREQKDPPVSVMWWPGRSWLSCDGSVAVNTGSWVRDGGRSVGYFTTVWAREKDGSWKWLLDHGDQLSKPRPVGDEVKAERLKCTGPKPVGPGWVILQRELPAATMIDGDAQQAEGRTTDGSLRWTVTVLPDKSRRVNAEIWTGSRFEPIIDDQVKAP